MSRVTVYKIILKSKQQNSLKDRRRSGRPKITNTQTDADIVTQFRDNPFKAVRSAVGDTGLKKDTIRRRLFAAGLRSYRPIIKPQLTDKHKQNRLQWADEHIRWFQLQRRIVLFCDKASFDVDFSDITFRCYRKKDKRFHPNMILEKTNREMDPLMFGVEFFGNLKNPPVRLKDMVTAERYVDNILMPYILPFLCNNDGGILMYHNAPPHTTHRTIDQ